MCSASRSNRCRTPRDDEVLIEVAYAGVNRPDCLQRAGTYPPPPDASPTLGLEVSGRIVACGAGVERWRVGDSVCALVAGRRLRGVLRRAGGMVPADPRQGDAARRGGTARNPLHRLEQRLRSRPSGGGRVDPDPRRHQRHRADGDPAREAIRRDSLRDRGLTPRRSLSAASIGADHAIDYKTQDFVAEVARITDKRGVDVVLDTIGGDYIARNLRCLATDGRLVMIGFLQGSKAEIDFRFLMVKRQTITGSTLRASPFERKAVLAKALEANVWPLYANGKLRTVTHAVFPLDEAAKAHALMESSAHVGQDPARAVRRQTLASTVARPPDASNTAPVENEHSSLASQHTSEAISSTVPKRPIGIFDSMKSMCCCVIWSKIAVRTAAGVTQLTRMPVFASSLPRLLVSPITAAFDAL